MAPSCWTSFARSSNGDIAELSPIKAFSYLTIIDGEALVSRGGMVPRLLNQGTNP